MASGKSWISQALGTLRSQWHFHMDLLDLWKDELGCVSLALFVMGIPKDLETYQKLLSYYEHLLYLFAFDTGFDPLVAIYDGEIRSTPWLYEFFSNSPIYLQVSGMYYNSKLEDVNTQFTTQFLGNLALFWTVIIPDIFLHTAASAPQTLFESKANKLLTMRYITLGSAGDFFKWMSHGYSLALKNYAPFIASPELWRVHNPIIDLYWWTLYSHILCLQAFKQIEESLRVKPFIETQKTVITVNGNDYAEARLVGDGEISLCIPYADLNRGYNRICFNSYNVISCVEEVELYAKWKPEGYQITNFGFTPNPGQCQLCDFTQLYTGTATYPYRGSRMYGGFLLWNPGLLRLRLSIDLNYTPSPYFDAGISTGYFSTPTTIQVRNYTINPATPTFTFDVPAVEFIRVTGGLTAKYGGQPAQPFTFGNLKFELLEDDVEIPFEDQWFLYPSVDPCSAVPWPE